jgi:hypothetical protein
MAIEVEYESENTEKKMKMFEKYDIPNAQIEVREIIKKVDGPKNKKGEYKWDTILTFFDNPTGFRENYCCPPCIPNQQQRKRNAEEAQELFKAEQAQRVVYEAPFMTSFQAPEQGKWIKGFLHKPRRCDEYKGHDLVEILPEEGALRNSAVRVTVPEGHVDATEGLEYDGGIVCVRIGELNDEGGSVYLTVDMVPGADLPLEELWEEEAEEAATKLQAAWRGLSARRGLAVAEAEAQPMEVEEAQPMQVEGANDEDMALRNRVVSQYGEAAWTRMQQNRAAALQRQPVAG